MSPNPVLTKAQSSDGTTRAERGIARCVNNGARVHDSMTTGTQRDSDHASAETLWCGHVFADRERQAHFGEFVGHRERPAGVPLDAVQTVPDSVGMNMQLGGGIGDRALIGKPRPEGVEEDIFFFGWQVIELAQYDGCNLIRYFW
jgi:hypothetical protein